MVGTAARWGRGGLSQTPFVLAASHLRPSMTRPLQAVPRQDMMAHLVAHLACLESVSTRSLELLDRLHPDALLELRLLRVAGLIASAAAIRLD